MAYAVQSVRVKLVRVSSHICLALAVLSAVWSSNAKVDNRVEENPSLFIEVNEFTKYVRPVVVMATEIMVLFVRLSCPSARRIH